MKKLMVTLCIAILLMATCMLYASAEESCTHPSSKWILVTPSTCTRQGVQHLVCTNCNVTLDVRNVAVIPCAFGNPGCEVPATCSMCGATKGSPIGHNFGPSTCVNPQTCTRCGKTTGGLGAHNWAPATCTSPSTCTICGNTTGTKKPHTYVNGRCTECGDIK